MRKQLAAWLVALAGIAAGACTVAAVAGELLEPEQAFKFSSRMIDGGTLELRYLIADGYYMYREKLRFDAGPGSVKLGEPELPRGKVKYDDTFRKNVETYRGELVATIPVMSGGEPFVLTAISQGCADLGVCYPPMTSQARIDPASVGAMSVGAQTGKRSSLVGGADATAATAKPAASELAGVEATLKDGNPGAVALLFFGFGLLLSLTPCVLPMVPILAAIIVKQSVPLNRARGFALALSYSLGMALVYTAIGIAAGLAGEGLAAFLQQPWLLVTFAALLFAMALSMFDVYDLQVPSALQTRIASLSDRLPGGGFVGVFGMGALSALIVGPCVAAPLAGALVYISQTRNVLLGGGALFSMAMGMCVPLLLVGASASNLLPHAGAWMQGVKRLFGFLLIATAIWMATPVLPDWLLVLTWAIFLMVAATFLRAFDRLPDDVHGIRRFGKGIGVALAVAGAIQLIGLASGGRDVLQPLSQLRSSIAAGADHAEVLRFEKVKSVAELEQRLAGSDRVAMLDFYADWCVSCKEMEKLTFSDPKVAARMNGMLLMRADVTANDNDDRALLKRFNLFGPPGIIFFRPHGAEIVEARVIGFQDAERFLTGLSTLGI